MDCPRPPDVAARVLTLERWIRSFGTNSHFSLSVVHFNSTIVHGIIGD